MCSLSYIDFNFLYRWSLSLSIINKWRINLSLLVYTVLSLNTTCHVGFFLCSIKITPYLDSSCHCYIFLFFQPRFFLALFQSITVHYFVWENWRDSSLLLPTPLHPCRWPVRSHQSLLLHCAHSLGQAYNMLMRKTHQLDFICVCYPPILETPLCIQRKPSFICVMPQRRKVWE